MDYSKVDNNIIVSGRINGKEVCKKCNVSFANGKEADLLFSMGYLPVVDNPVDYDPSTQIRTVSGIYEGDSVPEGATQITALYTVNEKTEHQLAVEQIIRLEAEITSRRYREAIAGTDNGWLANQESLIAEQRAKL